MRQRPRRPLRRDMKSPPGLSSFQSLLFARRLLRDPRAPIEECTRRFGPIWQSLAPSGSGKRLVPLVWLMGQSGNERVLGPQYKDDFTWYEGYRLTMEPLFGQKILLLLDDDPLTADGDRHRQRIRILVSAFHPRQDADYLPAIQSIVTQHLDALAAKDNGNGIQALDMQWVIKRLTFHIVAQLLLGAQAEDLAQLTQLFEEIGLGLFSLVHLPIPGLPYYRARRARAALQLYLQKQIDLCRQGQKTAPAMLEAMLAAQTANSALISDDAIIAELISFLYAGYDTTSSLLTSIVRALGDNAEVYARLRTALRENADPLNCSYLDAVLLEAERLYPPLLFLMRGVRRDITYAGFQIRAGSKVAYSPYYTHRMAALYPNPLVFSPERFVAENGTARRPEPYTLVGFGGGHRMCIGKRLAGLQMRIFLSQLLRRFDLTFSLEQLAQSEALYFNPAMQRRHGCKLRLKAA